MALDLDRLAADVEAELLARGGRRQRGGDEILDRCPSPDHEDKHPSWYYNVRKRAHECKSCGISGGLVKGKVPIVKLLGFDLDLYGDNGATSPATYAPSPPVEGRSSEPPADLAHSTLGKPSQTWQVRDPAGDLIALHCRFRDPDKEKTFRWWRAGRWNLDGIDAASLPLYGAHRLEDRQPGDDSPVLLAEGERATDALLDLGLPALGTVTGAGGTPSEASLKLLTGRPVVLWPDADDTGREHMARIAVRLEGIAASVRTFAPTGLLPGGDAVEWIERAGDDAVSKLLAAIEAEAVAEEEPSFESLDDGGRYRWKNPQLAVELEADYLRRESHQLKGELMVRCSLPGARTVGGVLSISDLNLSSARSRSMHAKHLAERAQTDKDFDWSGLLEEFSQQVLAAERQGAPALVLSEVPRPEPDEGLVVDGLPLLARHPMILFGDGGTCKSLLALYCLGKLAQRGKRVALFDWELDQHDHRLRLEQLFGADMPAIRYARCSRPLVFEADRLRRIVRDEGVGYVALDSVAFACDGPPESAEVASRYLQAARRLGVGALHVAHTVKARDRESERYANRRPFGSTFWHNGARSTWNVQRAETTPGDEAVHVALHHRKHNLSGRHAALGFRFEFGARIDVSRIDLSEVDDLARNLSTPERLCLLLRRGPIERERIPEEIPDVLPDTLRRAINRQIKAGKVLVLPGPGERLSLPARSGHE